MNAAIRRITDPETTIADAALAIALTGLVWLQVSLPLRFFFGRPPGPRFGPGGPENIFVRHVVPTPLTFLLIALCFLPLVLRRRYPVAVLAGTTVAYAAYELTRNPPALVIVAVLVALYTLGTLADRKTLALWGGGFGLVVLLLSVPSVTEAVFLTEVVRNFAMMLAAAVLGDATRNRRAYVEQFEQRAIEAERTREEEARRRVDEERLRIARELHDITAHSLSIVAVQSAAAAHVMDSDPAAAKRAIHVIRDTSRSALAELRAMLGVLRGAGEPAAPLAPTPGLARLGELVPPMTDAGLTVDVHVAPEVAELPPFVDASAYRIVQEALTNVLRHAGPAHVTVSVTAEAERLVIDVADDGSPSGATPEQEGHGISGMRERASALGGTFEAGPLPGRGWRVHAELPLQGRP
jgi:signal transduction histidine kinase